GLRARAVRLRVRARLRAAPGRGHASRGSRQPGRPGRVPRRRHGRRRAGCGVPASARSRGWGPGGVTTSHMPAPLLEVEGLTVADNLDVALSRYGEGMRRVVDYFPVLGERRDQLAGTLSGGEQQMLALARAVGAEPRLLMADELSLGLAPLLVRTITETLERVHEEEGRTILLVEQYATLALRLADLVYILNRGRLVWAGEPDELRASKVLVESYL